MRSLWTDWTEVRGRIAAHRRVLFLLDYDGTLAPLAISPGRAGIPSRTRSLLARLGALPRARVAVLSGRALGRLEASTGLPALYYGGNHGLEIRGPGIAFRHPGAVAAQALMQGLARRIRAQIGSSPGAHVENKGLTLSVHYRRVRPRDLPRLRAALRRLRAGTSDLPVRWSRGRKVWEVVPDVGWDKGSAALRLLGHLGNPFPVALGDDRTDEDLFAAVNGKGLSVRVGRKGTSRAKYYLNGQGQVARFLRLAGEALGAGS